MDSSEDDFNPLMAPTELIFWQDYQATFNQAQVPPSSSSSSALASSEETGQVIIEESDPYDPSMWLDTPFNGFDLMIDEVEMAGMITPASQVTLDTSVASQFSESMVRPGQYQLVQAFDVAIDTTTTDNLTAQEPTMVTPPSSPHRPSKAKSKPRARPKDKAEVAVRKRGRPRKEVPNGSLQDGNWIHDLSASQNPGNPFQQKLVPAGKKRNARHVPLEDANGTPVTCPAIYGQAEGSSEARS